MKWHLYTCSDCDNVEGAVIVPVTSDAHLSCPIDYCPSCGAYLSMGSSGEVEVTGNVAMAMMRGRK